AAAVQQAWQRNQSPAAFALLASTAARLPGNTELRQAVTSGYAAMVNPTGSMSSDRLHQRRQAAALAVLGNRELLTPAFIRTLAQNMNPELAGALPVLLQPTESGRSGGQAGAGSRDVFNSFLTSLREVSANPSPTTD